MRTTVEGPDLQDLLDPGPNRDVLEYLATSSSSCHSDTGDALLQAAQSCGEFVAYSPSFTECRYVALIANRRIFAVGAGMDSVYFRLPPDMCAIALQTGARKATKLGPEWVEFRLFQPDWPKPDLPFWALKAYATARG